MILLCHMLFGAAIAKIVNFLPLMFLLTFLSHYFLDAIPHWEYSVENIKNRQWRWSHRDFLKVFLDISLGIFLVLFLFGNTILIFAGAFFTILSDFLNLLYFIFPSNRLLNFHYALHAKTHFPKNKKILLFWRISSEVSVFFIAFILAFYQR